MSLSNETDQDVTVLYSTADGSATLANNDYVAASGTLTIPAGQSLTFMNGAVWNNQPGSTFTLPDSAKAHDATMRMTGPAMDKGHDGPTRARRGASARTPRR